MMATVGERIHDIDDDAKEMVNTHDSHLESLHPSVDRLVLWSLSILYWSEEI